MSNGSASRFSLMTTPFGTPDSYLAFAQTKGFFDTLTGDDCPPNPPGRVGNHLTDEERGADDSPEAAYRKTLDDIEKRKSTLRCYLAMVLDSNSLMLIRQECVDQKGLGDGHKEWWFFQGRFCSNETVTVVSLMRKLAHLQLKEDEALHNYFIWAERLSARLEQAAEHLSEPLLHAMVLNGLPERYQHFAMQERFNPAGSFVELRTRLSNYDESRLHREKVDDDNSHVAMISKRGKPRHKSSSKNINPSKLCNAKKNMPLLWYARPHHRSVL